VATLEQFQPRNGAGPVEALLRRAALRQVGNRTRGRRMSTT
jgi:hypothetical protein